ncbi:MAG TPA: hypothetical protein VK897_09795 [Anaerolineales bacterium]|nr:hypothetical protein [Anaerolineales bacterium]
MITKQSITIIFQVGILFLFALSTTGCGIGQPSAPTVTPAPRDTPVPTATATKLVSTLTPSAVPQAVMDPAEELLESIDQASFPVDEEIVAELDKLGYDLHEGELGWSQPNPLVLRANDQESPLADLQATNPIFADFILSIVINWGQFTKGDIGGCGIAFHAQDNFRGEAILFRTQLQPVSNSWNFEHWGDSYQGSLLGKSSIYKDGKYEDVIGPGKNHYVLVVDEGTAAAYANGKLIGSAKLPNGLVKGRIGVFPWAGAGSSVCSFTQGWVWRLP